MKKNNTGFFFLKAKNDSQVIPAFFKKNIYLFIYLVALGLSCGMRTLSCGMHVGSKVP